MTVIADNHYILSHGFVGMWKMNETLLIQHPFLVITMNRKRAFILFFTLVNTHCGLSRLVIKRWRVRLRRIVLSSNYSMFNWVVDVAMET